jgi:hypothetical protein
MTPQQDKEEAAAIDLAAANERVNKALHADQAESSNPHGFAADVALGTCPECHKPAMFRGRNRLSNCGHARRSHGKLVPVYEKPAQVSAQTIEQGVANTIKRLADVVQTATMRSQEADRVLRTAVAEFNGYVDSLTRA